MIRLPLIQLLKSALIVVLLNSTLGLATTYANTPPSPSPTELMKEATKKNLRLQYPDIQPVSLVNWVRDAAVMSFYYNYNNLDTWLADYSSYFTPLGWIHYYKALKNSGNIQKVKNDKITVTSTPIEPPKILWEGVDMNVYKWQVQVALLVHYQAETGKTVEQKLMITMMLRRTDAPTSKNGIAIDQFIAKPY